MSEDSILRRRKKSNIGVGLEPLTSASSVPLDLTNVTTKSSEKIWEYLDVYLEYIVRSFEQNALRTFFFSYLAVPEIVHTHFLTIPWARRQATSFKVVDK